MKEMIEKIIENRKSKSSIISEEIMKINSFREAILSIKKSLDSATGNKKDSCKNSIEEIYSSIASLEQLLEKLNRRFNRNYIAISAFGKTQDGKSTFWKSLTGIKEKEILPVGGIESCTMTKVSYINSATQSPDAKVIFYTKEELRDKINEELKIGGIKESISALDEENLNHLRPIVISKVEVLGDVTIKAQLKRLQSYIDCYEDYKNNLKPARDLEQVVPLNSVYKYIQKEIDGKDNPDYLPVKEVIIEKNINPNFGKIKFIDTRGIGEVFLSDGIFQQIWLHYQFIQIFAPLLKMYVKMR